MGDVILEKIKYGIVKRLSAEQIEDAQVNVDRFVGFMSDEIVISIRGFVWAESKSVQRKEVKYPSDWWQAWKDRFRFCLPKWFLERYPIKYTTVFLDAKAVYPEFRQRIPGYRATIHIFETTESDD